MGKVIAFSNHKGGVGKTTSTMNIGAGLSFLRKKVLLIDLDPQANMSQGFGFHAHPSNIYQALKEGKLRPLFVKDGLFIVPSTLDLSAAEIELSSEHGREYFLKELIDEVRDHYDFILLDCPPSLGLLTINAFTAADEIIVPLQAEYFAMQGLSKMVEAIDKVKKRLNKSLEIGGVIITQYDSRKILNNEVVSAAVDYFGEKVFKTKIRNNISLAEAPSQGLDIFSYSPNCNGAQDYTLLVTEIINR